MLNRIGRETRAHLAWQTVRGLTYAVRGWLRIWWDAFWNRDYEGRDHDLYIVRCEIQDVARWLSPFERNNCRECGGFSKVWWRFRRSNCPHDDLPF